MYRLYYPYYTLNKINIFVSLRGCVINSPYKIINVVKDEEDYIEFNLWSRIKETAIQGRRAGLGFTGMADAIAMLNTKYDSEQGLKYIEELMHTIFKGQLDSQIDMATERGSFKAWDSEKEFSGLSGNNAWYKWLFDNFKDEVIKRNLKIPFKSYFNNFFNI